MPFYRSQRTGRIGEYSAELASVFPDLIEVGKDARPLAKLEDLQSGDTAKLFGKRPATPKPPAPAPVEVNTPDPEKES